MGCLPSCPRSWWGRPVPRRRLPWGRRFHGECQMSPVGRRRRLEPALRFAQAPVTFWWRSERPGRRRTSLGSLGFSARLEFPLTLAAQLGEGNTAQPSSTSSSSASSSAPRPVVLPCGDYVQWGIRRTQSSIGNTSTRSGVEFSGEFGSSFRCARMQGPGRSKRSSLSHAEVAARHWAEVSADFGTPRIGFVVIPCLGPGYSRSL